MLILKLTNPEGESKYIAAAFPSACKTNLAMIVPTIPGWTAETVGDDICWMKFGDDGRLYAINPEAGFFGVAPGTGVATNPTAIGTLYANCVFTNTALTPDGDVWWEGMTDEPPAQATDWRGNPWTPESETLPRIPTPGSRRRRHSARRSPPSGRIPPASRSRRSSSAGACSTVPLVTQAYEWEHGVFLGSIMASETTAAQQGAVGKLRFDPMAMLPFCGYNMAEYFDHWLSIGKTSDPANLPALFFVNWFRHAEDGRFLWPGFGENSRDAEVGLRACRRRRRLVETAIGLLPAAGALDTTGLDVSDDDLAELLAVDVEGWREAIPQIREHYARFGDDIPAALQLAVDTLERRIADA